MTQKLTQKHILYGKQELELRDDFVRVKIVSLLHGNKELDVELAMLNPEPEITKTHVHFHSRVKCGPLISLYLNKPNQDEFNAFVETIKTKAQAEYATFAGLKR